MDTTKVNALMREILALPEGERPQLAQQVLPLLLSTRAGLEVVDEALREFSDHELDAIVERARSQSFASSSANVTAMKKIPKFKSEAQEREFWAKADSTRYVNWKRGRRVVFPNLKPSLKTISVRLPDLLLEELKLLANKRDVPYQSLLKIFLAERVEQELRGHRRKLARA